MKQSIKGSARRAKTEDAKARKLHQTADSYQNFAQQLGIGTSSSLSSSSYGFNPISRIRILLEWIHRGSWLGGVAVDLVAEDMTRAGVTITGEMDPGDMSKIERSMLVMGVWNKICDTIKWARLYGGCLAYIMIDGQNPSTPLRVESIGKGSFKGLLVLDRWMVEPSLNDLVTILGPDIGMPKFYTVTADGLPRMKIHYSRVLRLEGISLPYNQRLQENLWGISVIERLYDRMVMFDSATTGAAQLLYKSYIRTYAIENLREIIAAGGKAMDGLLAMVNFMRQTQGQEGITLIDSKDEFKVNTSNAFTGIGDALVHFGEQLAGALQIPLVRLFGQSPVGLNATGESDLRTYYDGIRQQQVKTLDVPVTNIYTACTRSLGIAIPPDFGIEFNPLWQLKDEERASVAQTVTATIISGQEAGLVGDKTSLQELKQSSRVTGIWTNITDEEIEAAEELPPPKPVLDPATNMPVTPDTDPEADEPKALPGEKKDVTTDSGQPGR
jgi:phage-related protein (TIGR01555 family)